MKMRTFEVISVQDWQQKYLNELHHNNNKPKQKINKSIKFWHFLLNFNSPEVKMSDVKMWTAILASAFIHTVVSPDTIQQYKKKCNRKKNSDS